MNCKKTILTCLLMALMPAYGAMAEKRQSDTSENKAKAETTKAVYKLVNNGKILSDFGCKNITKSDVISISVIEDTVMLTVRDEALRRLDKDPRHYTVKAGKANKPKKRIMPRRDNPSDDRNQ